MTLNLTKGGLAPATITNVKTKEVVKFMFNPFEYSITKSNTWQAKPVVGVNLPMVTFQQGGPQTISLQLHFDNLADGKDVRQFTAPLWKMMMIDQQTKNPRSGKGQPPNVIFAWGKLHFKAIITSMTEKFTLFTDKGIPLRCQVDIGLQQYLDESEAPPQTSQKSGSGTAPKTTQLIQGERMDHVAVSNGGKPSDYRKISADNKIDNPNRVPAGKKLKVNK